MGLKVPKIVIIIYSSIFTIVWYFSSCLHAVTLLVFITRIAKASQDNEQAEHAHMSSSLAHEMLPLVAGKESELVTIKIDPLREDLERKLMVTV